MAKDKEGTIATTSWTSFARGLNTLVNASKIRPDELSQADNILLVDTGSPTRRWGSANYGNDSGGDAVTGFFPYYDKTSSSQLCKIEDGLFKRLNTSTLNWDVVAGASFASNRQVNTAQLNNVLYLVNGYDKLAKYDGVSLTSFTAINTPTGLGLARGASLISGQHTVSYRISAVNEVGETLASSAVSIQVNRPRDEWNFDAASPNSNFSVGLTWNTVSGASGYNVYGVEPSFETFLDRVDGAGTLSYTDYGLKIPSTLFTPPLANTTDAPKFKYIRSFSSSLIGLGDPDNPSRVYYTAGIDKPDSFAIGDGGGFVDINKDSDDGGGTGIGIYQNNAIIFKERSTWRFDFNESSIISLQNINLGIGCISHRTILQVENDLFFMGRKPGGGAAAYVLGNEPNFLSVLRTNELTARVRPELAGLLAENYEASNAFYVDGKYIVNYIDGSGSVHNRSLVYDRERLGFTKWRDVALAQVLVYYDNNNDELVLFVDGNDLRVSQLNQNLAGDKGVPIVWEFATKQDDNKKPFDYRQFRWVNVNLRNAGGLLKIKLYTDNLLTQIGYNVNAEGTSTAFRAWQFRKGRFRQTVGGGGSSPNVYIARRIPFHRWGEAAIGKTFKLAIRGETLQSNVVLLDLSFEHKARSKNYYPLEEVYQH